MSAAEPLVAELVGTDPDSIRGAIRRLRAEAEAAEPREAICTRHACVTNLVIVLPDFVEEGECLECASCPGCAGAAFAIVLAPDAKLKGDDSRTRIVSARATTAKGRRCCEHVVLRFHPEALDDMAQTVEGLFVDELRRCVWWRREVEPERQLYRRLAASADRIIIDTRNMHGGGRLLRKVLDQMIHTDLAVLTDMNWGRITRWRELTAQVFDSSEERRLLSAIHGVEIVSEVSATGDVPLAPMMYLGWLAVVLKWSFESVSSESAGLLVRFHSHTAEPVIVHLSLLPEPAATGQILSVSILCHDPDGFSVLMERDGKAPAASIVISSAEAKRVSTCIAFPSLDPVRLLLDEIDYMQRDRVYEDALRVTVRILDTLES